MKQLGINQEEVEAKRVIIERADGKTVIDNPSVQKIKMQGQETWQIAGEAHEETIGIAENAVPKPKPQIECSDCGEKVDDDEFDKVRHLYSKHNFKADAYWKRCQQK